MRVQYRSKLKETNLLNVRLREIVFALTTFRFEECTAFYNKTVALDGLIMANRHPNL